MGSMVEVTLRSPLRDLAGGKGTVEIDGATVGEVIGRLETRFPKLTGWVLDERGHVRQHVNVFLNGERAATEAPVSERDRIHILPAISGGAEAELLVGTRKGLFVLRGERGGPMAVAARGVSGPVAGVAMRDPPRGSYFRPTTHAQSGRPLVPPG